MFLLDTNVVSELRRRKRAEPRVIAWAQPIDALDLFLSAITIFEIEKGSLLLEGRDPRQAAVLNQWIRTVILPAFAGRILPFDEAIAIRCATLHVPDPRPERDAMIAATALEHRLTIVTRNVADFAPMGVQLLNPWAEIDAQ